MILKSFNPDSKPLYSLFMQDGHFSYAGFNFFQFRIERIPEQRKAIGIERHGQACTGHESGFYCRERLTLCTQLHKKQFSFLIISVILFFNNNI
jgi:hypothetical protein